MLTTCSGTITRIKLQGSECRQSCDRPLLEQAQVFGQVVPLQQVLVALLPNGVHLLAQLPQLLLEEVGGPARLALLLLALVLVELLLQGAILLLQVAHLLDEAGEAVIELLQLSLLIAAGGQELLVDGLGQGEVNLVVGEAGGLRAGAGAGASRLLLLIAQAAGHHCRGHRAHVASSPGGGGQAGGHGGVGAHGDGLGASEGAPVGGGGEHWVAHGCRGRRRSGFFVAKVQR